MKSILAWQNLQYLTSNILQKYEEIKLSRIKGQTKWRHKMFLL
jgi:hypothetical protein